MNKVNEDRDFITLKFFLFVLEGKDTFCPFNEKKVSSKKQNLKKLSFTSFNENLLAVSSLVPNFSMTLTWS